MTPRRRIFSAMEEETDSMSPIGEPNKQASEEATTLAPGMKDRTFYYYFLLLLYYLLFYLFIIFYFIIIYYIILLFLLIYFYFFIFYN